MKTKVSFAAFFLFVFISLFFFPDFRVVLPPLVAIGLAFLTREVLISLFSGIWIGAVISIGFNSPSGFFSSAGKAFFKTIDTYVVKGLADSDHVMIIVFSLTIGGMVGIVSRSGGMKGIVNSLAKRTNTPAKAQLLTWLMGLFIFFDDYANTIIVGNSMRPLTDKLKISREKLSFIIDSTSAPVASVSLLSTWIGYELGLIGDSFKQIGLDTDPYMAFIYSLPYRFYAFLLLFIMPFIIFMRRDFGPMYDAEKRVIKTGRICDHEGEATTGSELAKLRMPPDEKCRWYNAAIPILLMILSTFIGIYVSGLANSSDPNAPFKDIISGANSFEVLIWGSLIATSAAVILTVSQRIISLEETMGAWIEGVKSMVTAIIILSLAWGLSSVTKELKTAQYISSVFSSSLHIGFLPVLVFIVASITSFATGTSWGAMAILFPTALPLAHAIGTAQGLPAEIVTEIIYAVIGSILTGAIFGDHCSPISDTTIMSSMSSGVNHMDHVRTQLPYALVFGVISTLMGYLPIGFGLNPFLSMLLQLAAAVTVIRYLGKKLPLSQIQSQAPST